MHIETERLTIRDLQADDVDALVALWSDALYSALVVACSPEGGVS